MSKQIYVWDRFVRVFHWSLLALLVFSYFTGEEEHWSHVYSGYAIFALISLRILWGFVGSKHARFSDFVRSPAGVWDYAKTIFSGSPKRYLGHNPTGGAMVLALLLTLFMVTLSGMKLYAVEEGKGPFAGEINVSPVMVAQAHLGEEHDEQAEDQKHEEGEDFWEEVHELAVNLLILLVALHVVGVVIASVQHRESLLKAMITGKKEDRGA